MNQGMKKGVFWILLATIGFSIIPVLAKLGFHTGLSASTLLFYRYIIASLVFYVLLKIKGVTLHLKKNGFRVVVGAGLIYALQCLCYFTAFNYISASIGAVLYNCYPVFVIIMSRLFLKDAVTQKKVIGVVTAIIGTIIVLYSKWETPEIIGILLIFAAAFVSSIYMVYNKKFTSEFDTTVLTMYICFVCAASFFIYSVIAGEFVVPVSMTIWANMTLLAVWSTIIGLYGFMRAISLLDVGLVAIINLAEPIFTILLSYIILHENLTIQQIIGSVIVICGIYFYENAFTFFVKRKRNFFCRHRSK